MGCCTGLSTGRCHGWRAFPEVPAVELAFSYSIGLISDLPAQPLIGRAGCDRPIGGEKHVGLTGRQPERFNVEGQLGREGTPDALGTAKPMPLTGKCEQDVPNTPALKCLGQGLGLHWRHHGVLQPMQQQHRPGNPVDSMQR